MRKTDRKRFRKIAFCKTAFCKTAFCKTGIEILVVLLLAAAPGLAVAAPIGNGFDVSFIETPGAAVGDVVVVGDALFVGVGSFGVGTQSLVRIDSGGSTVVAEGFNSLGGFAYDETNDRLIVGDNAGDLPGTLTGDTLYAISDPLTATGAPAQASALEILPAGSIPGYADVVLDPSDPTGDTLFVSDASGSFPPLGELLQVSVLSGSAVGVQSGLAFSAGLATDGTEIFVGEALLDFSGQVSSLAASDPTGALTLVSGGLPGLFDLEIGSGGALFSTAGSQLLAIDPLDGSTSLLASGFGFAAGLGVAGDTLYVVDGFPVGGEENRVWVLTPVPEPGAALLFASGLAVLGLRRRSRGGA